MFPFFADVSNLERITPAFLHLLTPFPIPMKSGALIDYDLRLYGVPTHWRTRIEISSSRRGLSPTFNFQALPSVATPARLC